MNGLRKLASYRADRSAIAGDLPRCWGEGRTSIYEFLRAQPANTDHSSLALPDEKPQDGAIRFAPGALDGEFGHHGARRL